MFDKLEALLAHAMLSIPATKGFEIGSGFDATKMKGTEHNDLFIKKGGQPQGERHHHCNHGSNGTSEGDSHRREQVISRKLERQLTETKEPEQSEKRDRVQLACLNTVTNNSGGVQGGISNGQDIVIRVAFKPPATIGLPQVSLLLLLLIILFI